MTVSPCPLAFPLAFGVFGNGHAHQEIRGHAKTGPVYFPRPLPTHLQFGSDYIPLPKSRTPVKVTRPSGLPFPCFFRPGVVG